MHGRFWSANTKAGNGAKRNFFWHGKQLFISSLPAVCLILVCEYLKVVYEIRIGVLSQQEDEAEIISPPSESGIRARHEVSSHPNASRGLLTSALNRSRSQQDEHFPQDAKKVYDISTQQFNALMENLKEFCYVTAEQLAPTVQQGISLLNAWKSTLSNLWNVITEVEREIAGDHTSADDRRNSR